MQTIKASFMNHWGIVNIIVILALSLTVSLALIALLKCLGVE